MTERELKTPAPGIKFRVEGAGRLYCELTVLDVETAGGTVLFLCDLWSGGDAGAMRTLLRTVKRYCDLRGCEAHAHVPLQAGVRKKLYERLGLAPGYILMIRKPLCPKQHPS